MLAHLDGIVFSLQARGGISTYFRELLSRLAQDSSLRTALSLHTPLPANQQWLNALPQVEQQPTPARVIERYRACPPLRGDTRPSLFHSTYYRVNGDPAIPSIVTVHDFAYERCVGGLKRWVHSWQKAQAIREARVIICVSEATRDDLMELMPPRPDQRVEVIYNGVSPLFQPLSKVATPARPFALFIGQRGRYKNFGVAAGALAHLPELELHCVGGGPIEDTELQAFPDTVRARIRHLGAVDDDRLNELYNQAQCLVYPSLYEGFGIPVIEAMRAGCPVVGIDCKAVREVGGSALLVASNTPAGIAEAVLHAGGSARAEIREQGRVISQRFNWDNTYQATLRAYRLALS